MTVSDVILWAYVVLSFVPIVTAFGKRTSKKWVFRIRWEAGLAVTAIPVGTFSDNLWLYFFVAALWAFNTLMSVRTLRYIEEREELEARIEAALKEVGEKK